MRTEHANHLSQKRKAKHAAGVPPTHTDSEIFYSTVLPGPENPVPAAFGRLLKEIESILGMPVLVVIQNNCPHCGEGLDIGFQLYKAIQLSVNMLPDGDRK